MSLYLQSYIDNPLTYEEPNILLFGGITWNLYLVTPPRIYKESMTSLKAFFYVGPPEDSYVLWAAFAQVHWPGWEMQAIYFDAQTGALKRRENLGASSFSYLGGAEWGEFNHIYATFGNTTDCKQLNWVTGAPQPELWHIHPNSWSPKRIFSQILVNRTNDRLFGIVYPNMEIWDNVLTTPTLSWQMRLPETVRDLAYESNQYGWILTTTGKILKLAWGDNKRIEMFSSIQAYNAEDKGYALAYDSNRQRIAIYRWRNDATDGAARNRIEFYQPIPKPAILTEPVPIGAHRANDITRFIANAVGDMGEGFACQQGLANMIAPNNHGRVVTPNPMTDLNGEFVVTYQAPAVAATETLGISVDYEDDISILTE